MEHPSLDDRPARRLAVPISWKLLAATAVVAAVAATIAIIGLTRIQAINKSLNETVDFLAAKVTLASVAKQDLVTATRAERNMLFARNQESADTFAGVVDEVAAALDTHVMKLRGLVEKEDRYQLDFLAKRWGEWRANHEKVRHFLAMNSDQQAHSISIGEASMAIARLEELLNSMTKQYQREFEEATENGDTHASTMAVKKLTLVAGIWWTALEMQRDEKDLLLTFTHDDMKRHEVAFEQLEKRLQGNIQKLIRLSTEDTQAAVDEIREAAAQYVAANRQIRAVAGERSSLSAYHFVYDIGDPIAANCEAILDGVIRNNEREMQDRRHASQLMYATARKTFLMMSIIGIVVSVVVSFFTGQGIARRLVILSRYAETIHNTDDLSKPTPQLGDDEVGLLADSFERMRTSLHRQSVSLQMQTAELATLTQTVEAKNKELEQFVYLVSHDLKSPLVSCKGLLGLLHEDVADRNFEAIIESTRRLDEATDQLNHIIDGLLMLSRIGNKPLQLQEVDVSELLDGLIKELDDRITEARAEVNVEPDLPRIIADASDVRRLFENCITNALKYAGNVTPLTVTVGATICQDEVRYCIRDNGPGIDPKYHDRIFGLFQRLDTVQAGTGLGLASVAKIMSMYGGRVWVESDVGQGATFWLAFPGASRPAAT